MSDIITIDIGNTRVKAVVFSVDGEVISCHVDPNLEDLLEKYKESRIIYSSVRRMDGVDFSEGQFSLLKEQGAIEFGISLCGVLDIGIQGVETLGRDRLAGMMAARYLKPGLNCLVIDAGTCLTYDYLGFDGFYGGGGISMGMDMRYRSLNEFTQKLPRLYATDLGAETMVGRDIGDRTNAAIHSGILGGLFDELNARTDRFKAEFANSAIILTGGDADFLVKHIKNEIFVEPLLVHYGLYYALHSV